MAELSLEDKPKMAEADLIEEENVNFWAYSERDMPWKVCYHMIIFGSWMQYAWMICWLIMKVNYEWTTIWWLIFMLCIAQVSFCFGLFGVVMLTIMLREAFVWIAA